MRTKVLSLLIILLMLLSGTLIHAQSQSNSAILMVPGISQEDYTSVLNTKFIPVFDQSTEPYTKVIVDVGKRYGYSHIEGFIEQLSKSKIVKAYQIGTSVDQRKIYSMEIGSGKNVILLDAGIHSRENANPSFILKYIADLVNDYQANKPAIKSYLAKNKIVVVPCSNPDGYLLTQFGKKILRNKTVYAYRVSDTTLKSFKANANGVDLSRNFPTYLASSYWGKKKGTYLSTKPSYAYYAGPSLGSEPETKAMMAWLIQYIPLASAYVDFHSQGRVIYYGKPHLSDAYNRSASALTAKLTKVTGYNKNTNTSDEMGTDTDGTITDFAAEIASGFVYNTTIKRLAPVSEGNVKIPKFTTLKYKVAICTPETMNTTDGNLAKRTQEWNKCHLSTMFSTILNLTVKK